jgi:4-amino-4-deoxychorismate lyase
MCRLLETMMIVNKTIRNTDYHNARMNQSRRELFSSTTSLDVRDVVVAPNSLGAMVKCRLLYAENVISVSYESYVPRRVRTLQLVRRDDISYRFKFEDRKMFEEALQHKHECDDILIVQEGRITDTSFSNVALFDGRRWVTPAEPLLKGTMRASLLDRGLIVEEDVRADDLPHISQIMLINALRDFDPHDTIGIEALSALG